MEITPGRAVFSPDEEWKPLRSPKTYPSEVSAPQSTLSIYAAEFVPSATVVTHNVQDRLRIHQRPNVQENYLQYQQPEQQAQQQQQQQQQVQQSYSNGYDHQQQNFQYGQPKQNFNTRANVSNVQDRLRNINNAGVRSGDRISYYTQQQQQHVSGGQQSDYPANNYRYNKNHFNENRQHQHHNQQQQNQQQQQNHEMNDQQTSASAMAESANSMENIALDYLQTVIQCLNQNPGQFDSIATPFNNIFEGMENNHFVLSIAMEDIFKESTKNPNFRYMGAKLYNLLHTLNPSKDSLFHTLLKCKLDFHQQQVREYIQNKQENKVRETALFLAELYMQLRGEDSRNYLIAENIVFSLKELLSLEDNKDNIRCICLTLKLAGYDLSTDRPADMQDIIGKLDTINRQNPGKYPLANNVISLQKNNWGRKPTGAESLAGAAQTTKPVHDSDDPVFYGPDGREITAEECEFLNNGAAGTATSSDNEDNDDGDLDPEMDEETERDYKLFLQQSNNKS